MVNVLDYYGAELITTIKSLTELAHRDCSIHIERANMHCQGITCTRSFDMGLKSAEGQNLECFK